MPKFKYKRDAQDLVDALTLYTPIGMKVITPEGGTGEIDYFHAPPLRLAPEERQTPTSSTMYRIKLDKPISFDSYAESSSASREREPVTLEELEETFGAFGLEVLGDEWVTMVLETGISPRDRLWASLRTQGCLGGRAEGFVVTCLWFIWTEVALKKAGRGDLVSLLSDAGTLSGRILGTKDGTVFLELLQPMHILETPQGTKPEELQPSMVLDVAWGYGSGLHAAIEEAEREDLLPEGEWNQAGTVYMLKKAVPIAELKKFCKEAFPDQDACIWQALTVLVLPLPELAGRWVPIVPHDAQMGGMELTVSELEQPWETGGPVVFE